VAKRREVALPEKFRKRQIRLAIEPKTHSSISLSGFQVQWAIILAKLMAPSASFLRMP